MGATGIVIAPTAQARITLSDGRRLGYAEYGDPSGRPVIYCHGFPGSRLEPRIAAGVAEELGVRLIAPDRPGYGLSDFQRGREILHWPADVHELADILGLGRFAVVGTSGGGPYALACAHSLAGRITAAGVVCSLGPLCEPELLCDMAPRARLGMALARKAPRMLELVLRLQMAAGPQRFAGALTPALPKPDADAMAEDRLRQAFAEAVHESMRNGTRGIALDLRLYSLPWGFDLEKTKAQVILWQGEADTIVPASHGRYLARRLPNCEAHFVPGEGHFSLPINYARQVLSALIAA